MVWIIGIIIVAVLVLPKLDTGLFATQEVCVSNEPNNITDFHNLLQNEGFQFSIVDLEKGILMASKNSFYLGIRSFPIFLDGPDITINNCHDYLISQTMCKKIFNTIQIPF